MKLLNSFILAVVALILAIILIPIGLIVATIFLIFKLDSTLTVKYFSRVFINLALAIDVWANFVMAPMFNMLLLKRNKSCYRFGKVGETISSSLGKNVLANNLSFLGRALNKLLDFFEKDHSIKSIDV